MKGDSKSIKYENNLSLLNNCHCHFLNENPSPYPMRHIVREILTEKNSRQQTNMTPESIKAIQKPCFLQKKRKIWGKFWETKFQILAT